MNERATNDGSVRTRANKTQHKMNDNDIKGLSDEALNSTIRSLEEKSLHRTREGYISEEAGKAIGELTPYRKEQKRRAELKRKQERDQLLADIEAKATAEREQGERLRKLYPSFKF